MTARPGGRIFHLTPSHRWKAHADVGGAYAGDQFERHGFVHCCTREQLVEVARWWFPDDELVALEIASERLTAQLRYEASPTRWYPHVYGALDPEAIVAAHDVPRDSTGAPALPPPLAEPPPGFSVTVRRGSRTCTATWRSGELQGDPEVVAAARAAIARGRRVPAYGGVELPPSCATPYEAFCLLLAQVDELLAYQGDGFFDT